MKAVFVLLAIAVTYAYGGPIQEAKEMKIAVDIVLKNLSKQPNTTYVIELEENIASQCEPEFFCQVEKVLSGNKEVPQLPNFQDVKSLIRKLEAHNKHHVKTCTVKSTGQEISLHQFLESLKKCIQKNISNAPRN